MLSGVPSYRSTLDSLTYTNVEPRPVLWNFEVEFLEHSLKPGYTCMAFKTHGLLEYTYEKVLCVDSMSEIEFNAVSNSC